MPWGRHLGGVPISHNALQHYPEFHGADTWEGTLPGPARGYPARGYPGRVPPSGPGQDGEGGTQVGYHLVGLVPLARSGGYPLAGYPPQVPPRPGQDGGGYLVRTTEGVLTTRRAVCLLRSRRRTFLLIIIAQLICCRFHEKFPSVLYSM